MSARQVGEQVFSPPLQTLDLAAAQARGKVLGQRKSEVRPVLIDAREHAAVERRLEAAPHDFDFGQLGHIGVFRVDRPLRTPA